MIDLFQHVSIGKEGAWKPVQSGVLLSTFSVLELQNRFLNILNFKFLLTARLTQDCLENLFSCVRSKNAVPTALEFKNTLHLLTVSQYLKGATSGSYDLDDGGFVADFLSDKITVMQTTEIVSDRLLSVCQPLIERESLQVEFDEVDLSCLYYLCGYVLSRVLRSDATCDSCIEAVKSMDYVQEFSSTITKLFSLKEFRVGALVPCSTTAFNLLLSAEIVFRQHEPSLLSSVGSIKQQLISHVHSVNTDIIMPDCHNIKLKVVRRFLGLRLQIFAKKQVCSL